MCLDLNRTPDILAELGTAKRDRQVLVGFAAETEDIEANALAKLEAKRLDFVVANDVSRDDAGFDVDTNAATVYSSTGGRYEIPLTSKREMAEQILDLVRPAFAGSARPLDMPTSQPDIHLSDDRSRLDMKRVQAWLSSTYWSPGASMEQVQRAADGSAMVIGAYLGSGEQVGYCRVVSDRATFAWICDVFVDESQRGRGLAKRMVKFALAHPEYQELRRWMLATRDAHGIYAECGFVPLTEPERWMTYPPISS